MGPTIRTLSMLDAAEEAALRDEIAADPDARELTDDELMSLRPAREVLPPALYEALVRDAARLRREAAAKDG